MSDEEDPAAPERFAYLHLRDASVVLGSVPTVPGMLWRVRINQVSAWTFGRLPAG